MKIRITKNAISFAQEGGDWVNYTVKREMSIAANLREAFRSGKWQTGEQAAILTDSTTLLIPIDEYYAMSSKEQFLYINPEAKQDVIKRCVVPALKTVVIFSIDKDVHTVLTDNFLTTRYEPLMLRQWDKMYIQSEKHSGKTLFAYFHDEKVELCSFTRNRFAFANSFEVNAMYDAVFFIVGAWKQLNLSNDSDQLVLVGTPPERETLTGELYKFISHISLTP